jgi:hypothetical protein
MSTDAVNTSGQLAYVYPALKVYLGDSSGAAPPDSSPSAFAGVWCERVVQSASGSRLDYAELRYNLSAPLQNRAQPANFARMVDVRLPSSPEIKIARGDYVTEKADVQMQGDSLSAQIQLRPYHFGGPLTGTFILSAPAFVDNPSTAEGWLRDDIVFNPIIDGRLLGNRSDITIPASVSASRTAYYFTHPEALDSTLAMTQTNETRNLWTMRQALAYLLWDLAWDYGHSNRARFVDTPDAAGITLVNDSLVTGPQVRDLRIPIGTYLPQALDLLLIPLGYNWYVDYDRATKPIIKIFQIGTGTQKELKLQAVGATLNLANSNCNQFSVENAIADSFNEVLIFGDYDRREVTVPLFAGWDELKDNIDAWTVQKDGDQYTNNEDVWRLWIANEGADLDITPTNPRPGGTVKIPYFGTLSGAVTGYTSGSVFNVPQAIRHRVMEPPITGAKDISTGRIQPLPHLLEYSTDSGATWKPAEPDWSFQLLPDQIGVLFDGHEIPSELYEAKAAARLRLTGTIASDHRIADIATQVTADCVNAREFLQVLVQPDKYRKVTRQTTGPFATRYDATNYPHSFTVDDTSLISVQAEALRNQNHFADVSCEFRLPGWHTEYKIGDLITKIAGREISLNAAPAGASQNRYVQIVERRFENSDNGGPSTVLIVDRGVAQ